MYTGIIAEFNPLHHGHESIMRFANGLPDSEGVIAILSSNFTQRGSPSITDKFTRAKMAVMAGADVVIELPFLWACSAGHDFAGGATGIMGRLGCVSRIVFGMENPDFDAGSVAGILVNEPETYREILHTELKRGASFPKAVSIALEAVIPGSREFMTRPNNMLAVSYMAEIMRHGYGIEAVPFMRQGSVKSRDIRADMAGNAHMMPGYSREILTEAERSGRMSYEAGLWPILQGIFIRSTAEDLCGIYGIDEGIEGLFLRQWKDSCGISDFVGRCTCARYTGAHIRRRLVYVMLGLERERVIAAMNDGVPYARVLAFTEKGRGILRRCRNAAGIPVITRLKDADGETGKFVAETEYRASQLYELTVRNPDMTRESRKVLRLP